MKKNYSKAIPIKPEAGKRYIMRNGELTNELNKSTNSKSAFFDLDGNSWNKEGLADPEDYPNEHDIVEVYHGDDGLLPEGEIVFTLQEKTMTDVEIRTEILECLFDNLPRMVEIVHDCSAQFREEKEDYFKWLGEMGFRIMKSYLEAAGVWKYMEAK